MEDTPYGPEKNKEKKFELPKNEKDLDLLLGKTFSTGPGIEVMKWMKEKYVEGPAAGYVIDRMGQINAMASTFDMYQREGQRILVKNIEMRIKRANTG